MLYIQAIQNIPTDPKKIPLMEKKIGGYVQKALLVNEKKNE